MKNILFFTLLSANLLFTLDLSANEQLSKDPRLVEANSYVAIKIGPSEIDPRDGTALKLNYKKAVRHCAKKGSRLPFPREYQVVNGGRESILESNFPELSIDDPVVRREMKFMEENWWFYVSKKNDQGIQVVDFYFNERTLWNEAAEEKPINFYWTLREDPSDSSWAFAYKNGGRKERVYVASPNPKSEKFLVRCVEK